MITPEEWDVLFMCVEWFLYGIYSGIFAIYLQIASKDSRTTTIIFYALCLLYVLSTATAISDLVKNLSFSDVVSNNSILNISVVQITVNGFCDFIAQCTLIYRCWIVWGKNIRVVIIPSFLGITYLATWLAAIGAYIKDHIDSDLIYEWGNTLILTALAASMVVNALVTGLIVFKILKVFLEVRVTSVKQTLGSLNSTGGSKLRHITFIIIESGMALFAIQLVRVVITSLSELQSEQMLLSILIASDFVIIIHQALNGIASTIILVRVSMKLSYDDQESVGSLNLNNPPSNLDSDHSLQSSSSMPPEERNEEHHT